MFAKLQKKLYLCNVISIKSGWLIVPCLKNAIKRIMINPLSSGFWRGYIDQERRVGPTGKCYNIEYVVRLPEF